MSTTRVYSVAVAPASNTVALDLFEVAPADDKPIEIHSIVVFQTSDVGDAAEEIIGIEVRRGGTGMTSGSGGNTGVTAQPLNSNAAAAGAAIETMNTSAATFTSGVLVYQDGWNVRTPFVYYPPPEDRIIVTQVNGGLVVRMTAAPVDALTIGCNLVFAEIA